MKLMLQLVQLIMVRIIDAYMYMNIYTSCILEQGESTVVIVTVLVPVCVFIAASSSGVLIVFGAIYFKRKVREYLFILY